MGSRSALMMIPIQGQQMLQKQCVAVISGGTSVGRRFTGSIPGRVALLAERHRDVAETAFSLPAAARPRAIVATRLLHGRTRYRAVRAIHATVSALGLEYRATALAVVIVLASIRRHCRGLLVSTVQTRESGTEFDGHVPTTSTCGSLRRP